MEATPERDEILEFIKNAKRGIMKGYLSLIIGRKINNEKNFIYWHRFNGLAHG